MGSFGNGLWLFFIYSFLGWCVEVVFAAAKHGRFINRGFLMGCICPIYGFGMVAVLGVLLPVKDNIVLLFFGSVIIATVIEFLIGYISEKILHTKLWDYSNCAFNIGGYVCLMFSLLWGIGGLTVVTTIHPIIEKLISIIPDPLNVILLCAVSVVALTDFAITGINALHIDSHMKAVTEASHLLSSMSDRIGSEISEQTLKVKEKVEEAEPELRAKYEVLLEKRNIVRDHMFNAFPHLREDKYKHAFEFIENWKKRSNGDSENK